MTLSTPGPAGQDEEQLDSSAGDAWTYSGSGAAHAGGSASAAPLRGQRGRLARGARRALRLSWPIVLGTVLLVLVWQLVVTLTGLRPEVLPSPRIVWDSGWAERATLLSNTGPTVEETVLGLAIAVATAWIFAVVIDSFAFARRACYPLLVASQSVPVIVIAPLFVIWFGFSLMPKVLIVVIVTFFPTMVGLLEGFASCEKEAMRLLRSMGANRRQLLVKLRLPNAMPYFFTGLRVSVTYGVVAAIFGEFVGGTSGLGIFMQQEENAFRTDLVLDAVIVTAVLSMLLYGSTYVVQRLVMPWYYRGRETAAQEGRKPRPAGQTGLTR
jgi:ABC-type nitrate/sulfonate/bicarbonate transport system permease component